MGGKEASPQKTGPRSQRFRGTFLVLQEGSERFKLSKACWRKVLQNYQLSAELWEPSQAFLRNGPKYSFGEHGFKHRLAPTEFRRVSPVGSTLPIFRVPKRSHWVFRRTHQACRQLRLSEFSLPKQYSRNSIPPGSWLLVCSRLGTQLRLRALQSHVERESHCLRNSIPPVAYLQALQILLSLYQN